MTDAQKIQFADRISNMLQDFATSEDIPIMVGTLNTPTGIRGFELAEVGHPVFEYKDKYVIYLESKTPDKIVSPNKNVEYKDFKVAISYYKNTLKLSIDFINSNVV